MTDRPMLFSGPMVRALLDGRKTQTRRLPRKPGRHKPSLLKDGWSDSYVLDPGNARWLADEVRWRPGDRAWVREMWARHARAEDRVYAKGDGHPWGSPIYRATFDAMLAPVCEGFTPWRPSIHMPRWASRLTLLIEDVRVQRLQDISEEDAAAEGVEHDSDGWRHYLMTSPTRRCPSARDSFRTLSTSIHGPGAWDANPWVVKLGFRAVPRNIDALAADLEGKTDATTV